ncbi:MAG: methyltransferase domain-containing protein, partial [Rhodothermales bacterium]
SGYGASARQLAADFGVDVTAVTLSPAQHAYAVRQSAENHAPTYVLGNWLENDLPEDSYDAAYAIESLSHITDLSRCVEEVRRVLRRGGRFVICAWTAVEKPTNRQVRYLLDPICRDGRLAHLSTVTHYAETLERAGFVIEEFRDLTDGVRRTWTLALRRTAAALLSQPSLVRTLARSDGEHRTFLTTIVRIWMAYRTEAMRYGLLKARNTDGGGRPANLA